MDEREAEEIVTAIGTKADELGRASLTEHEKNIHTPWWARGIIGNGGFKYLLEHAVDIGDVARRFRALGLEAAATACEQVALAIFSVGSQPTEKARKRQVLAGVNWRQFDPQEDAIFELTWEEIHRAIASYIEDHRDMFAAYRSR